MATADALASTTLFWIPLGAGGHSVRYNGRVYEAIVARLQHRDRRALFHAALELRVDGERVVIELAPESRSRHGSVARGPVGARIAGRLRLFRYELRCSSDGVIPDVGEAVDSPIVVSDDPDCARRILRAAPNVPCLVWGRDELGVGDMWNSNSAVSWLLEQGGVDATSIALPRGGRAPGWDAGIAAARRGHLRGAV